MMLVKWLGEERARGKRGGELDCKINLIYYK